MNNLEFRFIFIGGLNTVIGYLVSIAIYEALAKHLELIIITIINAIVTITISFYMQRTFVFKSNAPWFKEYLKMYFVNAISIFANIFLIWLTVDIFAVKFWLAQAIITFLLTIYMYFAHKYFTFKSKKI